MNRDILRRARVSTVETPLKRPFVTALGRRTHTCNVGLALTLSGGAEGYGEASTSLAMKHLTAPALARVLSVLSRSVLGSDVRDWRAHVAAAWKRYPEHPPAVAAFESALVAALCAQAGTTVAAFFGGKLRSLETDLTLSAWDDARMTRDAAAEAARDGFQTLKIKVGGTFAADLARVRAVRAGAPRARLILDGNQGLSPRGALQLLDAVRQTGAKVDLLEQPVRKDDLKGMAFVAKRAGVPVAADESVATPAQAVEALEKGAATAINIKLAKSGLSRALEIAAVARAAKVPLMIGCMAETARGLASSVHFALGTGFFRFADLDSDVLLREPASARKKAGWVRRGAAVSLLFLAALVRAQGLPHPFTAYEPTYVLPLYDSFSPDKGVYGNTLPDGQTLNDIEVKYQISFKAALASTGVARQAYLAYTQTSFWQLYRDSAFFRETNYEPALLIIPDYRLDLGKGWELSFRAIPFEHQSNGRGGSLERSWDRTAGDLVFERPEGTAGDGLTLDLRAWGVWHDPAYQRYNPDLARHMGYGRQSAAYRVGAWEFAVWFRNQLESGFHRGALEADVRRSFGINWDLYAQYFNGFGQSLIEYNHYTNSFGVGLALRTR